MLDKVVKIAQLGNGEMSRAQREICSIAHAIVVRDELPSNAVGKADGVALKQMADAVVNRHLE